MKKTCNQVSGEESENNKMRNQWWYHLSSARTTEKKRENRMRSPSQRFFVQIHLNKKEKRKKEIWKEKQRHRFCLHTMPQFA